MTRASRSALLVVALAACGRDAPRPDTTAVRRPAAPAAARAALDTNAQVSRAESLYYAGEYARARELWTASLGTNGVASDSALQAHVLMWLGLAAWRLGEYPRARELGERALALKQRLGRSHELARSYNALGLLARDEGRLVDAAALFERSASAAAASSDSIGLARAAGNLALVQLDLGDFDAARRGFETARSAGLAAGDRRLAGNALTNLGMMTIRLGDPAAAIPMLQEARRLYADADYETGQQNMLAQLATAYDALGEPQRAFAALDTATRLAERLGLEPERASNLRLFAELYQGLGDHARALSYFERAERLGAGLALAQELGVVHRAKARSQWQLGNAAGARESVARALALHRAQRAAFEELTDLLLLAEIDSAGAAGTNRWLADARGVVARLGVPAARADLALAEARIADRRGDARRTIDVLDAASRDLALARLGAAWEPHALRARAYSRLDRLDSAIAEGRSAVGRLQQVRSRIGTGALRTSFTAERTAAYGDLVVALLRARRTTEAFEVADAARGRALLEHLASVRAGVRGGAAGRQAEAESLLRRIDALRAMLRERERTPARERTPSDTVRTEHVARQLARAEGEYEAMQAVAVRGDWRESALLGVRPARFAEVRAALAPHEALVQYMVLRDRLLAFVVTARGADCFTTTIDETDLSARVRVAREVLGRRGPEPRRADAILASLYDVAVRPAREAGALDGVTRIVVVPHAALVYLPFAALLDRATGEYLGDRFAVLHLPSTAALSALRSREAAPATRRALAVFAPLPATLPATRREAAELRRTVDVARVLEGARATEGELRRAMEALRGVHVASHASLNASNPLFSYVALAPGPGRTRADDGRLELHEVFGLRIAASLVYLSGCETGLGPAWTNEFTRGEDYVTLGQTFLAAGARDVVSTLWRIDDAGAAAFAAAFYRHLDRLDPPEALAAAQRQMRRDARYTAPYYWAAYQVSGAGRKPGLESEWWNPFN